MCAVLCEPSLSPDSIIKGINYVIQQLKSWGPRVRILVIGALAVLCRWHAREVSSVPARLRAAYSKPWGIGNGAVSHQCWPSGWAQPVQQYEVGPLGRWESLGSPENAPLCANADAPVLSRPLRVAQAHVIHLEMHVPCRAVSAH